MVARDDAASARARLVAIAFVADSPSSPDGTKTFAGLAPSMLRYARQMFVVALFGALLWERTSLPFLKITADFEQIGFYTAAFGVSVLLLRVPGVLAQVLLPVVAELEGAGASPEVLGTMFRRAARLLSLIIIPPVVLLWVTAPWVIDLMFGAQYQESTGLLRILLVPLLFAGPGAAGAKTLVGAGQQVQLLKIVAVTASLKLLLCALLIPSFGAIGAAVAVAVSWSLAMVAEGVTAARCFPDDPAGGRPTNSGAD